MRAITLAYAGLCGLAVIGAGAANAEPLKIREGWVAPGNWGSIWLQKKDLTKHFGQSYVVRCMDEDTRRARAALARMPDAFPPLGSVPDKIKEEVRR